ncbi:12170_t:CDS:2, partial [Dentiscutata erythropus]
MSETPKISFITQKDGDIQQDKPEKILADIESESPKVKICITAQEDKTEKIFITKLLDQYHEFRETVLVLLIISFLISFFALFIAVYLKKNERIENPNRPINLNRPINPTLEDIAKNGADKLSNTIPLVVDSLTALLSGGGIIIGFKKFFFSSKEYINLMHKPIENEVVIGTRRVIKNLKLIKNIYATITTIGSIIIFILVVINLVHLATSDNSISNNDTCQIFTDCITYVQSINSTVGCDSSVPCDNQDNLICQISNSNLAYFNTTYVNNDICPPAVSEIFISQEKFNYYETNNIAVLALGATGIILNVCLLIFYFNRFGTSKIRMESDTKNNLY